MLVKQVREGSAQLEELMLGKQVDAWPQHPFLQEGLLSS